MVPTATRSLARSKADMHLQLSPSHYPMPAGHRICESRLQWMVESREDGGPDAYERDSERCLADHG